MGENSGIAWTDHTYNYWEGCTKVGPGCDACYAADRDVRYHAGSHWGPGAPRRIMSEHTRNNPMRWQKQAAADPNFPNRVFCSSLGDVFDNEVPGEWRRDLFRIWRETPNLRWQVVTKRIGNAARMLPPDWKTAYPNVGIMITVVTQEEADRDIPKLLDLPAAWRGISCEPQIEPINFRPFLARGIDWIVTGGESKQPGHEPRPYNILWAEDIIRDCRFFNAAAFVKQTGANPIGCDAPRDGAGDDMAHWPRNIRVREFPEALA